MSNRHRLVGIGSLICAVLVFVSVIVYAFITGQQITPLRHQQTVQTVHNVQPPTPIVPAQSAPSCTTPTHALGDSNQTITSGGVKRTLLVHLPPSYGKQPQALVVNYHGYSWTAQSQEHNTNMATEADSAGFVLVFPQGLEYPPTWNAGVGTGDADDIQFTRDLLSYMEKQYCVDTHRVYVTGFSLGGGMAYRVACTLSQQITALATVSGAYYPLAEGCHPARPVPVLEIHGAADTQAPYAGNASRHMAAVQDYLNLWLDLDKCEKTASVFFQQGDVKGTEWTHCAPNTSVRHYRVNDGGHSWPGTPNTTHVIDANSVIWQFFSQFSLA